MNAREVLGKAIEICREERNKWQSSREILPDDVSGAHCACDNILIELRALAAEVKDDPQGSAAGDLTREQIEDLRYRMHDWCNKNFTGVDIVEDAQELLSDATALCNMALRSVKEER